MADQVVLDHIEIHVEDIDRYGAFLTDLFKGGRFKQISDSGTSMFITQQGQNFEIKARNAPGAQVKNGLCLPCIRTRDAKSHLDDLGLVVDEMITNPEGQVFFFTDHEGIQWHVKSYDHMDRYINW